MRKGLSFTVKIFIKEGDSIMYKKILSVLLVMAVLLSMMPNVFATEAETPDYKVSPDTPAYGVTISMGSVTANPGDTVDIPVSLDYAFTENVTELQIRLNTNSLLTLNSITAAEGLAEGLTVTKTGSDDFPNLVLKMEDGSAFTLPKGQIAVLNYTVSAEAPGGDIAVSGADGNAYTWVYIENDTNKYDGKTVAHTNLPGSITVAAAEGLTALAAPALPAEGHTVSYDSISLAAPAASSEDETAVVQYRYTLDGSHWSAWQTNASFSDVMGGTKYYFQARYQTTAEGKTSSAASAVLELTTPEPPWYNVTFRVIGASLPTATPSINRSSADYKGAVYQNWLKTISYQALAGSTAEDLIYQALTDAGFTYTEGKPASMSITAPEEYGGHTITAKDSLLGSSSRWMITINNNGEYRTESYSGFGSALNDGDEVILHFVFKYNYEKHGQAHESNTWAVADISPAVYGAATNAMALIDAIGRVTPDSKAAIDAARAAYNAVPESVKSFVTNYETLAAAESAYELIVANEELRVTMPTPVIAAGTSGLYTVTPTVTVEGVDAADYTVVYRLSLDGTNWGIWQVGETIDKLLPNTTYYVQAMAQTNDWTAYGDSAVSEAITVTTAGADVATVQVSNADELMAALTGAATDGTLTVIDFTKTIVINDIRQANWTAVIPDGANVLMTTSNGSAFFFNECGGASNITLGAGTTVTVKGMTMSMLNHQLVKDDSYGPGNVPGAAWHRIFNLKDTTATVNLVDVEMYNDSSSHGLIEDISNGATVNLYSGTIRGLGMKALTLKVGTAFNLIPMGDILVEGTVSNVSTFNLMPMFGCLVSGAVSSVEGGEFTALNGAQLAADVVNYVYSLRLNMSDAAKVPPVALDAPIVLPADDTNAATADVVYTIEDNQIIFVVNNRYGKDGNAVIRFFQQSFSYWRSFADVTDTDKTGLGNTFTYSGLTQDTDYEFTIVFASLDGSYTDAQTVITLRTTYTPAVLDAPTLSDECEKTESSITVTTPAASAQDTTAVVLYRIRKGGTETWSAWQESLTFTGLEGYTDYEIQAMYKAQHHLWLDSAESNTVTIKTKAPVLQAPPAVKAEDVTAEFDAITVPVPAASSQDPDAAVMYRIGTLKDAAGLLQTRSVTEDQITWGEWQESNVFTGLEADTTYYVQSQYVTEKAEWNNSVLSEIVEIKTATNESAPHFKVESAAGKAGSEVKVVISIKNNPGIITAYLNIGYDATKLQLMGYEDLKLLPDGSFSALDANPFKAQWDGALLPGNLTANGDILVLTFKILEGCQIGDVTDVTVTYNPNEIYDFNMQNVKFAVVNGTVTVTSHIWGEATYTWNADHTECTATHSCTCCETAVSESETVSAAIDTVPPTETEKGSSTYTANFTKTGFTTQTYVKILPATGTLIEIGTAEGCIGEEIKVNVTFAQNPGVAGAELILGYDTDKLEFVGFENGEILSNMMTNDKYNGNQLYISWVNDANAEGDGVVLTLTFKIKDSCAVGDTAVVSIVSFKAHDYDTTDVEFNPMDGNVSVVDHSWGEWVYTWNADNTACTAQREQTCGCGAAEMQTVKAALVAKDCTSETYLAHFTNGAEDQIIVVSINDHDYEISGNENGDEIIYTCRECGDSYTETVEADDGKFVISEITGKHSDTVEVTLSIMGNPGLTYAQLALSFDTAALKLVEIKNAGLFEQVTLDGNVLTLGSEDEVGDTTGDGVIVTLVFQILADTDQDISVGMTYSTGDIRNYNGNAVVMGIDNGIVTVYSYILGDVNRDGVVDIKDVTVLRRYLAGTIAEADVDLLAADCNGDGVVDIKDVTVLRRYLAGTAELGK